MRNNTRKQIIDILAEILPLEQKALQSLIMAELKELGAIYQDGGIKVVSPNPYAPTLVCHTDTAGKSPRANQLVIEGEVISIEKPRSRQVLGGDDRCGVATLLYVARYYEEYGYPHLVFCEDEEKGCQGAWKIDVSGLESTAYLVEIDRRECGQAVFYNGEPKEFKRWIASFGFFVESGSFSDVYALGRRLKRCSTNLSAGYTNEHSTKEIIVLPALLYTVERLREMLTFPTQTWELKVVEESRWWDYYSRNYRWETDDDDDEDDYNIYGCSDEYAELPVDDYYDGVTFSTVINGVEGQAWREGDVLWAYAGGLFYTFDFEKDEWVLVED